MPAIAALHARGRRAGRARQAAVRGRPRGGRRAARASSATRPCAREAIDARRASGRSRRASRSSRSATARCPGPKGNLEAFVHAAPGITAHRAGYSARPPHEIRPAARRHLPDRLPRPARLRARPAVPGEGGARHVRRQRVRGDAARLGLLADAVRCSCRSGAASRTASGAGRCSSGRSPGPRSTMAGLGLGLAWGRQHRLALRRAHLRRHRDGEPRHGERVHRGHHEARGAREGHGPHRRGVRPRVHPRAGRRRRALEDRDRRPPRRACRASSRRGSASSISCGSCSGSPSRCRPRSARPRRAASSRRSTSRPCARRSRSPASRSRWR